MKKLLSILVLSLLGSVLNSSIAMAKGTEISLFSGYRTGGDLENAETGNTASFDETNSYGVILGLDYGPEHVMEFLYSKQTTDLTSNGIKLINVDIEYFQIGGSQIWVDKKVDKFFGATFGAIHLSPNTSISRSSETKFAMSMGGGIVYKFTDNVGLRLELRGYFASLGNGEYFCGGAGSINCVIIGNGFMSQFDANAGLRIRF